MSARNEGHVRLAGAILLLLVAAAAAPLLDEAVGFLSDAPYVQYLPMVLDRGADTGLNDVLTSACLPL